jgi:hypothetical protein
VTGYMSYIRPSMVGCRPHVRHDVMGFTNCVRHSLIGYSDFIRHSMMGYTSGISSGTVGTITCPMLSHQVQKDLPYFEVFSLNLVLKYVQSC